MKQPGIKHLGTFKDVIATRENSVIRQRQVGGIRFAKMMAASTLEASSKAYGDADGGVRVGAPAEKPPLMKPASVNSDELCRTLLGGVKGLCRTV
jgi:hypothetical protein